jgi:hypothetical protein
VPLLSDWSGEATRGFDVCFELLGMEDVATRSAFLIEGESREIANVRMPARSRSGLLSRRSSSSFVQPADQSKA